MIRSCLKGNAQLPEFSGIQAIHIDGKTARGSYDHSGDISNGHLALLVTLCPASHPDFSRDVEREEWFASKSGELLTHHFLYLEVSSSKSFKPWLRVSMERAKASILALAVICSRASRYA